MAPSLLFCAAAYVASSSRLASPTWSNIALKVNTCAIARPSLKWSIRRSTAFYGVRFFEQAAGRRSLFPSFEVRAQGQTAADQSEPAEEGVTEEVPASPEALLENVLSQISELREPPSPEFVDEIAYASEAAITALRETRTKIAELEAVYSELDVNYKRLAADFMNFRNRSSQEKIVAEDRARGSVLKAVLPVLDNFERAKDALQAETEQEKVINQNYQSVYKLFVDALKRIGVTPIEAKGQMFDAELHEAFIRQPSAEYPEGTILQELQRGYVMDGKILRAASVIVAVPDPSAPVAEPVASDATA
eukprot:CAMPEP_0184656252 /NCGR_PEP_ID=MMETSP0308-20130426/16120_1 /TAXON_ID=38269 /ORGANISM="Gloeochaete witrockiana, Strain SAG 46.84" /LENGTH=305 /DNA_ID=CAMNT_0027093283 /DNA_START=26 /DNA_END=943 /DNA_ORIENTATION=+